MFKRWLPSRRGPGDARSEQRSDAGAAAVARPAGVRTPRQRAGDAAEARALAHLQAHGLALVQRNYRVARGASARGGEIDLVMRERDGTLVFVEVRARADAGHGGAAASVGAIKQRRLVWAAQQYLRSLPALPPCRFDVVALDGERLEWLRGAFDAS